MTSLSESRMELESKGSQIVEVGDAKNRPLEGLKQL